MIFIKLCLLGILFLSCSAANAVEVRTDNNWHQEERGYKYTYISEQPSEAVIRTFTAALMGGVWERDLIAYGNSINTFQARLRTKDMNAKPPFPRENRHWFDKKLNGDTISLHLTGTPNEINDALQSYTEQGYTPALRKVGTPIDTVYLLLTKG